RCTETTARAPDRCDGRHTRKEGGDVNVAVGPLPVAGAASSPGAAAPEARPPGGAREPGFSKALSGALSRSAAERPRGAARAAPGAAGSDEAGAPAEDRRRSVEAAAGAVAALIAQMAPLSENPPAEAAAGTGDRKSTRLNSSHVKISYAVFCV